MFRSIFFIAFAIAFMVNENEAEADLINCCTNFEDCRTICNARRCQYTMCCTNGTCTVGGAVIPVCGCTCVNCPNQDLAASGLLGSSKFISADEQTIKFSNTDSLNVTKN